MPLQFHVRFKNVEFKAAREAAGLSVTHLASMSGVREGTIENWEAGRVNPRTVHLVAACAALRREPSDFWEVSQEEARS